MSSALYRLGGWCSRHVGRVVAMWMAALLTLGGLTAAFGGAFNDTFSIPSSSSQKALVQLGMTFPEASGLSALAIVVPPEGTRVSDPAVRQVIEDAVTAFGEIPEVAGALSPWNEIASGLVAPGERAAIIQLRLNLRQAGEEELQPIVKVARAIQSKLPAGSTVTMGGEAFSIELPSLSVVEALGVGVALVVLTIVLGSLIAAGMPIVTALIGVGVTMSVMMLIANVSTINSVTPMLSVMLGLAVGIDYALFILSRHRDQLHDPDLSVQESTARSVATAGSAVVFAGVTVVIALLGLVVADIPFLTVMGAFAAIGVGLAVIIALTLLPALMGWAGERLRPRSPRRTYSQPGRRIRPYPANEAQPQPDNETRPHPDNGMSKSSFSLDRKTPSTPISGDEQENLLIPSNEGAQLPPGEATQLPSNEGAQLPPNQGTQRGRFFRSWVRAAIHWPWITVLGVLVACMAMSIPAKDLHLSLPNSGQHAATASDRIAYDQIATHFGVGFNGPLIVTVDLLSSTDPLGVMAGIKEDVLAIPGVQSVLISTPNRNADTGFLQVIPTTAPDDVATQHLVEKLRGRSDDWLSRYGTTSAVTGLTAIQIDVSERLASALFPFGLFVIGLSLVLLTIVFRSIAVPIKAALGYLLSVGVAFGATTMVFNHGWFNDVVHLEKPMAVISFLPILLMGILFGLAMDYEVFLVSRIREEYVHGKSARDAIVDGFTASGKVVAAAAVIMVAVFAFFVPEGMGPIKAIAFALAIGIAVDAFVVRMTLVPAVLALLGDKAWWLPGWLEKRLPSLDVEGESLARELTLKHWPDNGSSVYAEGLGVNGILSGFDICVEPGGTHLISGDQVGTAALLALAGRLRITEGRARVAGALLPEQAAQVRLRTAYLDPTQSDSIAAEVAQARIRKTPVIIVDHADLLATQSDRAAVQELVATATESGHTVLLGGRTEQVQSLVSGDSHHDVPARTSTSVEERTLAECTDQR